MTRPGADSPQWALVDEGWGRKVVDFATLSEPGNCREYVAVHHRLGVDAGERLLDVACGSGLAIELARLRGASCSGIDASARLVAVARDRNPGCDIRVGDMHALPWDPASFDVVTSFRGIWGTTPDAIAEIYRVLRPGGRAGITVWGHLKVSPGAWALAPFRLAAAEKVGNQAVMVSLGRPGAGEQLLASHGFLDVERLEVPFAWEFADPELYARALASSGPAYEAIQNVGEAEFHRAAVEQAQGQLRDGLPLRADINVVGPRRRVRTPRPRRRSRTACPRSTAPGRSRSSRRTSSSRPCTGSKARTSSSWCARPQSLRSTPTSALAAGRLRGPFVRQGWLPQPGVQRPELAS